MFDESYWAQVADAAGFIRERVGSVPKIAIMAGTGLGACADTLSINGVYAYRDIPHFPVSTVVGHKGRLLTGEIKGCPAMVFQGRVHLYEGYSPLQVTFPIRLMQRLGVKYLVATNAAGGLNPEYKAGDVMLIKDHINLTGANPLVGPNSETHGERFPDMTRVYDGTLLKIMDAVCEEAGVPVQKGVYAGLLGPSLETPAEIRYLRIIGADAVGLSTVQEVIAAVHAGIKIAGLSVITNTANPDKPEPADVTAIIDVAEKTAPLIDSIIGEVVHRLF